MLDEIALMKDDLVNRPSAGLLDRARLYLDAHEGEEVPDWVHALANGNPDRWQAVIEVAQADLRFGSDAAE